MNFVPAQDKKLAVISRFWETTHFSLLSAFGRKGAEMGYELNRFKSTVNPDLICFICKHVAENPVQVKCCKNIFCEKCINDFLQINNYCPDDGQPLDVSLILVAHKFVVNSINDLHICCGFAANGCQVEVKVREIKDHEKMCGFSRRDGDEEEKRAKKCKECESLSSDIKQVKEEMTQMKEENKLITEILKKQINAFEEIRTEMMRMREDAELLRQEIEGKLDETMNKMKETVEEMKRQKDDLRQEMREETDLLRQEMFEYNRNEFVGRENERRNEKDEGKTDPETPLLLLSKEHEDLVIRLKREGVIKSDKVFNAMKAIDGKNYFPSGDQYTNLAAHVDSLEEIGAHLKKGFNVLFVNVWFLPYYFPCLAEMVGEKGSVVAFVKNDEQRESVEKDHNYFLFSKRLTLEVKKTKERKRGSPLSSPFHLIIVEVMNLNTSEIQELTKQLTPGGKIIHCN